jgi:uncharacterized protein involved in exopolysaccharide biosynthesis
MNPSHEDHREVVPSLRREWVILVRRRRMILAVLTLAVSGAAVFTYGAQPLYEGGAIISAGEWIPEQPYARLNADVPRLKSVLDREIARITSRELGTEIVRHMGPSGCAELALGPLGPW